MEKRLADSSGEIVYTSTVSMRAKRMRIVIYPGGRVTLVIPKKTRVHDAETFLKSKLMWVRTKLTEQKVYGGPKKVYTHADYLLYKERVLTMVNEKLKYYSAQHGFSYGKVTIKNHKTLWGSCSRRGNLNFNYKLGLLPETLLEYVVVHELCHLKVFNHSKAFWDLVSGILPEYKELRLELKQKSFVL